jgi:hypothetical protein
MAVGDGQKLDPRAGGGLGLFPRLDTQHGEGVPAARIQTVADGGRCHHAT